MPLGMKPVCSACKSNESKMWTKGEKGEILCNECVTKQTHGGKEQNGNGANQSKKGGPNSESAQERVLRKSSRNKPSKYRVSAKPVATKGKGRRIIFKKSQPVKAPTAVSTVVTGKSIFHEGTYYQVGDIVSLVDDDENVYYAQIRGFLQDQYYEKSAVITWLLPTRDSYTGRFDPSTYILGPEEDLPRKMVYMEFVCHAPSDYFRSSKTPYPTINNSPELCYIWSSLGPEIRLAPTKLDDIFGPDDSLKTDNNVPQTPPKKTKVEKVKVKEEKKFIVVE
ncbi:GATA zinc finger domain-containing protein 1-like [Mercenaria mercenaria]|uniref:GATA zinc finger domain-containing protein 1-like n=1 Tax=Mercenaria mercenaria TaxID=6596 RepID=UPI00234EA974|nr:GATA zinc finger domain-containing protein 1-like [Mercenaria mercenaria]